ncbi:MAG: NAD(P)/FAD-dependent oxidoreductase [Spirochaetales bacterium]
MHVIVVGGGPAGMMAAIRAAERGARVTVVEKNTSLGHKLLISGGGRCNFTNAEPEVRVLAEHYGEAARALLSPFSKFSSLDCLAWFAQRGMPYKVEEHQRAFPADNAAASVLRVLQNELRRLKVELRLGVAVTGLLAASGNLTGVQTARGPLSADFVILATGGTSHPETGSTGDGFSWLAALGHRIRYPEPSLVPVAVKERWIGELQGLSFAQGRIEAWVGTEKHLSRTGKFLITHFGLSGPMVLNMASELSQLRQKTARLGELVLKLDFFPDKSRDELDEDLRTRFATQPAKKLKNGLTGVLPPRLGTRVLELAKADPEKSLNQLTRDERLAVVALLKEFPLTFKRLMDETRAVVSSGGLQLDEVDFRTMTSKRVAGLAVTGDLLDINRPSGGYSLQLCWSTGWVAGTISPP